MATPNIETIIRDRVTLTIDCIDRLYLNGYVPRLQTSGQIVGFLRDHLGYSIPSPALLRPLHDRFVRAVTSFADAGKIPVVCFERGQRKDDVGLGKTPLPPRGRVHQGGRAGELVQGASGRPEGGPLHFSRQSVSVNHYYFYLRIGNGDGLREGGTCRTVRVS
jgi:hypothetical protein